MRLHISLLYYSYMKEMHLLLLAEYKKAVLVLNCHCPILYHLLVLCESIKVATIH